MFRRCLDHLRINTNKRNKLDHSSLSLSKEHPNKTGPPHMLNSKMPWTFWTSSKGNSLQSPWCIISFWKL